LRPQARRYPRQELLQTLALLLWDTPALAPAEFAGRVEDYARTWHRFN